MICQDQSEVCSFLGAPDTFGVPAVEEIDTHISRIFLAGDRVYKLKRAVKLPYADFSAPEIRRATCDKEVALNAAHAPGLYFGTRRITRAASGGLEFDGTGPLVDAVVEMARFEQDALFDQMASRGDLTAAQMTELAYTIARFHAAAPVVRDTTGVQNLAVVLDINRAGFATSDVFSGTEIAALDSAFRRALDHHGDRLNQRAEIGQIRRCHGDLHLRNICMFRGRPTLFDCIEFNDQIATVDVLYDLAFLLMDLWHRDLQEFASLIVNRYFDETGHDGDFVLLPLLMAIRAAVRAHVTATHAMDGGVGADGVRAEARAYFDMASGLLETQPPRAFAIGGFSGTGKSTIAQALAPQVAPPPGARIFESDRTRKAMYDVSAETRLPEAAYAPDVSDRVYAALGTRAVSVLRAGAPVIVDAVFDRADRRRDIEQALAGYPFAGIWLTASPDTLRHRVATRRGGASDADEAVLMAQLARGKGALSWRDVSTDQGVAQSVSAILSAAAHDVP